MPVLDAILTELPAELDQLTVAIGREVDQPLQWAFELDAHRVQAQHCFEKLLFRALDRIPRLLLARVVIAVGAGTLDRILGHAELLLEVGPQRRELRDLRDDGAHAWQLAVGLVDRVSTEPLHRSTILRSMDPTAMRGRLEDARVARLATADANGKPHVVPITFAVDGDTLYFAVDAKPK